MNKLFPVIPAGQPVHCFNCNRPLTGQPAPVDNPPARGRWRAYCSTCDMFTFFDFEVTP